MSVTIIALPTIADPFQVSWGLQRNDSSFRSPFNGYTQDLERPGSMWVATLTWQILTDSDTAKINSWLTRMSKAGVRCRIPNFGYTRHGPGGGTPLVNGGSQTGLSLVTDGWSTGVTGIVKDGDMIQLATGQLVMATADANSDVSGNVTIAIEPALRTSPADNSAITLAAPTALFKLSPSGGGGSQGVAPDFAVAYAPSNPAPVGSISIQLIEDVS